MKAQANQIRPGWVLDHNGKQYSVTKIDIIQPGKGGAFIQVEMRDVSNGVKTQQRWRTADTVEKLMGFPIPDVLNDLLLCPNYHFC